MKKKSILTLILIFSSLFSKELELGSMLPMGDHRLLDIGGKYLIFFCFAILDKSFDIKILFKKLNLYKILV